MPAVDDPSRLQDLFEAHHGRVLAYALRRTAIEADAEDAAAETFSVAWRRIADAPTDALPWLYAIARRVLANQRRSGLRRMALRVRLARAEPQVRQQLGDRPGAAMAALASLHPDDQELLRLVAWEELSHAQVAESLGVSVNAVAIRVHRARKRLRDALAAADRLKGSDGVRTSRQEQGKPRDGTRREEER